MLLAIKHQNTALYSGRRHCRACRRAANTRYLDVKKEND